MKFLLDTNICIYIIKQKPPYVLQKFRSFTIGDIGISSITVAELAYGVAKSGRSQQNQRALEQFLVPLAVAEFDQRAATAYGTIRAALEAQGTPIGPLDFLIAAHALSLNLTLVTNNLKEFSRIPQLQVEDWAAMA
jgi:tRNA(fMet)-specific endonuclease VapC